MSWGKGKIFPDLLPYFLMDLLLGKILPNYFFKLISSIASLIQETKLGYIVYLSELARHFCSLRL